ncbi:hypothetical protein [Natranaerobius thermophilus]|uniref:DUF2007 domain-containing protein n=1 Tax=Natranaerobius thermophilus (strain ATCC BAA-1301 / DSM 18059 / JW/NM-WN-LF) TaxID=457570 RepID=B2A876_NATTJ|nr:hypothetical protein [Natranaerobius thermophilus]ACB84442.1 hypothetical protein Nther_0857 [Natranaerobius thermophilus JW/NM-WN-LF]
MFDFSLLQVLLIIFATIAIVTHFIYDKKSWVEFHSGTQSNSEQIYQIYSFLKKNGVKCRVKDKNQPFSRMQNSQSVIVTIEIKKGEEDKANRLLSDFNS